MASRPEVWLRGPVAGVPPLLQSVAHSLLQSAEEARAGLEGVAPEFLGARPGGAASPGFHLQHAMGSLDRLFTYARGASLDDAQRRAMEREKDPASAMGPDELIEAFDAAVERAIEQLRHTDSSTLLDARAVGRAGLPSTVIGLLVHGAEHTLRHVGQFVTTIRILQGSPAGAGQ